MLNRKRKCKRLSMARVCGSPLTASWAHSCLYPAGNARCPLHQLTSNQHLYMCIGPKAIRLRAHTPPISLPVGIFSNFKYPQLIFKQGIQQLIWNLFIMSEFFSAFEPIQCNSELQSTLFTHILNTYRNILSIYTWTFFNNCMCNEQRGPIRTIKKIKAQLTK